MHTANYDIEQGIEHKLALNWWVRHTLNKNE